MGVVWFFVLWFGTLVVGGAISGVVYSAKAPIPEKIPATMAGAFEHGQQMGRQAGFEFGARYGGIILLGALLVSIVGTATGKLPGTKPKKHKDPEPA